MTIDEITSTVSTRKPVTRRQIYRYVEALNLHPLGIRQRPQQYPDNSADVILAHLGLSGAPTHTTTTTRNGGRGHKPAPVRIPTISELQTVRRKARGK